MQKQKIEFKNISYAYEGEASHVCEDLSLVFGEKKVHLICGPSGCGKSSILYILNGLIPHLYEGKIEGDVCLDGKSIINDYPKIRCKDIALVMQNPEDLFCTFTVEEELAFGLENLGESPETIDKKIDEILSFFSLSDYRFSDLNNLSGGQKQKLAIACAVICEPKYLLLDEPTANLDPKSRMQVFNLIRRLCDEKNITIIIVEHNIDEIIPFTDRILTFDKNKKLYEFTSEDKDDVTRLLDRQRKKYENTVKTNCQTDEEILSVKNLTFSYDKRPLINNFNMSVKSGEFLAIAGDNGAGKTTLLKLILKLLIPESGNIEIFGKDISKYTKNELYSLVGLVFQNPEDQFITNTIYSEMDFSLRKSGLSREEKDKKIQHMLRQFDLYDDKDKSPFVLSQGQKRRLSVATMLLTDQKILFLDEPTYGQDFENCKKLMDDMQDLIRKGITIIMITHDMDIVEHYATRTIKLDRK